MNRLKSFKDKVKNGKKATLKALQYCQSSIALLILSYTPLVILYVANHVMKPQLISMPMCNVQCAPSNIYIFFPVIFIRMFEQFWCGLFQWIFPMENDFTWKIVFKRKHLL